MSPPANGTRRGLDGVEVSMTEEGESKQIAMMEHMVALAEKQTGFSAMRSEMSEVRSYLNAERTLSVWVRTALSLMIVGIAVDRFDLLVYRIPGAIGPAPLVHGAMLDAVSSWACIALVLLGVVMVLATGIRFFAYARAWNRQHQFPAHHGPFLAPTFAGMVALFGIVLLAIMMMATG
jgi:putative membrane protein